MFFSAGAIFFLAGTVQGVAGFGAGLVAIPLLCLIMDIKMAVPLCILNGLIITSYLAFTLRHHLDIRKILPLLLGALPGIPVGVILLKHVDQQLLQVFIGIILITYSLYNLLVKPGPVSLHVCWGYFAGFLTGAITAALSAGGPPAIVYTTMTDWKKDVIKATLTGFFVLNACFAFVVQMANGIITQQVLLSFLGTAPFVLAGTVFGSMVSGKLDRSTYLRLIYCFLMAMGVMMLI
jgi:uncharacterized membrane protein YfcA